MRSSQKKKNQGVSYTCSQVILILCILLLIITVILNIFFSEALFIQGVNFIYDYQTAQPYPAIMFIQNFFSLLCNPRGIAVIFLFYLILLNRKLLLIVHVSYFLTGVYFMAVLKQAFQQSRPIWYDDRIQNWQWFCPKDFGNPSGHSFATFLLFQPIVADVTGFGRLYQGWVFIMVLGLMVPLSRMYLGVHSANQILIGLTLGLIFLVAYRYVYQKALYRFFWDLLVTRKNKLKVILIIFCHVLVVVIPIIFFIINEKERPMEKKDIDNLNNRCGTSLTGPQVQEHIMLACGIGCLGFGLCYGFLALSRKPGYKKYLLGMWQHASCKDIALKILIYIVCCFIPGVFLVALGKFVIHNSIVSYLFFCAGITIAGFGLSYWAPLISLKYRVIRLLPEEEGDYEDED